MVKIVREELDRTTAQALAHARFSNISTCAGTNICVWLNTAMCINWPICTDDLVGLQVLAR